jgi:hypothetical protein
VSRPPEAGSPESRDAGEVLSDRTSDEQDVGWGDDLAADQRAADERLLADRPPHWDDR